MFWSTVLDNWTFGPEFRILRAADPAVIRFVATRAVTPGTASECVNHRVARIESRLRMNEPADRITGCSRFFHTGTYWNQEPLGVFVRLATASLGIRLRRRTLFSTLKKIPADHVRCRCPPLEADLTSRVP
jgi:hypothetical protein